MHIWTAGFEHERREQIGTLKEIHNGLYYLEFLQDEAVAMVFAGLIFRHQDSLFLLYTIFKLILMVFKIDTKST